MVAVLSIELATYVDELCVVAEQSDSTAASGNSRESEACADYSKETFLSWTIKYNTE